MYPTREAHPGAPIHLGTVRPDRLTDARDDMLHDIAEGKNMQ